MNTNRRTIVAGMLLAPFAADAAKLGGPIEDALDRLNGAIDAALAGQLEIAVALAPILLPPGPLGDVGGPRVSNPIADKIHRAATRVANLTALQQQLLGRIQL